MIDTKVFVTFREAAFHRWPDAPDKYAFLRSVHRHEFHFRVDITVYPVVKDREVEFISAKQVICAAMLKLTRARYFGCVDFGTWSCEDIARSLGYRLREKFGYLVSRVEVSEDGENGAVVTWETSSERV